MDYCAEIVAAYRAGEAAKVTAHRLGLRVATILELKRKLVGSRKELIAKRNAVMADLYEGGASIGALARQFGLGMQATKNAVARHTSGRVAPKDRAIRSTQMRDVIRSRYAEGFRRAEIAAELSISPSAVSYHTKAMGLVFACGYYARRDVRART